MSTLILNNHYENKKGWETRLQLEKCDGDYDKKKDMKGD
jgi:hypothetical protein